MPLVAKLLGIVALALVALVLRTGTDPRYDDLELR
jgi:hypothetical protein